MQMSVVVKHQYAAPIPEISPAIPAGERISRLEPSNWNSECDTGMSVTQVATTRTNQQHRRRLIITADDFGLNARVNEAVERLHQAGVLTQASLMVNEAGVEEAVRIAKRNPSLTVGLHLSLCAGLASRVSRITDAQGRMPDSPARAGLRYAFDRRLIPDLAEEIVAQFTRFRQLGFSAAYWDGHTHLHLHPTVLRLTLPAALSHGFGAVRLVQERRRGMLPFIFQQLSNAAKRKLGNIRYTDEIFGLEHTGQMTTERVESILAAVREGWSELYLHPGADPAELDMVRIQELLRQHRIELASSRDLSEQGEERAISQVQPFG